MNPPYIHIETTPISLAGDQVILASLVDSTCIVQRSAPTHTINVGGHWSYSRQTVTNGTQTRHNISPRLIGDYYIDTLVSIDTYTWVPPTFNSTPATVLINVAKPSNMISGDTLVACWGQYDLSASTQFQNILGKNIPDLPQLPAGLSYGSELSSLPHLLIANSLIQNDFADGTTNCCPAAVEPKAEVNLGSSSLYASLRNAAVAVDANDDDQLGSVIQSVTQPGTQPQYPIDGTMRRHNNASFSDPTDADTTVFTAATPACDAYAPTTVGTGTAALTNHFRIRQNTNAGTLCYTKGIYDWTDLGRAQRTQSGNTPDRPDGYQILNYSRTYYNNDGSIVYGWGNISVSVGDVPSTIWAPVITDAAISPGPDLTDDKSGTTSSDGAWVVDIPVDTTPPMELRCRQAFSHQYPWAWQSVADTITLHIRITTTGALWQFWPVGNGSTGVTYSIQDLYSVFGLDTDRSVFGASRQVLNQGYSSAALQLRRSDDNDSSFSVMALNFSGQGPSILCLSDHTHLIGYSDGTNIVIKRVDDEGNTVQTMPSPGAGKLASLYTSHTDHESPVWCAACTVATGSGSIIVYKTHDAYGLTGWEAAVTVVSNIPAQKPTLEGSLSELQLWYHNGTSTLYKVSYDAGATWSDPV